VHAPAYHGDNQATERTRAHTLLCYAQAHPPPGQRQCTANATTPPAKARRPHAGRARRYPLGPVGSAAIGSTGGRGGLRWHLAHERQLAEPAPPQPHKLVLQQACGARASRGSPAGGGGPSIGTAHGLGGRCSARARGGACPSGQYRSWHLLRYIGYPWYSRGAGGRGAHVRQSESADAFARRRQARRLYLRMRFIHH
jgi:hypothetical protein